MRAVVPPDEGSYSYAGMGYANPDAVTQIANGLSTTTYSYDQNGSLTQKTTDGVTTTYLWDYANRLIALGSGGATTTYGYDAFGSRVFQSTATSTTIYPFKWYSVASSTGTGATYATTTEYIWTPSGDTLVSTVDQQFASGVATGNAKTKYIHPDHLGSTNVVTDDTGAVVETLDYYPYGGTRINSTSGNYSGAGRQYVNRFADQSSLDYLNNRYYDPSRGQFVTQDPIFWSRKQNLADPQSLNSYSYANDNPISRKDPDGLLTQAQNSQLSSIAAQLQAISAQISALQAVQCSGGTILPGAVSSIQKQISSASAAVTTISNGGLATLSPSLQWSPPSKPGFVAPITPNMINGISGVPGGNDKSGGEIFGNALFLLLPGGAIPGAIIRSAEAVDFFEGTVYSAKVVRQMEWGAQAIHDANDYHAFPELVRNFAPNGYVTNGVGDAYRALNIPGGYNGEEGVFQFMKNSEGVINHRLFIPN